jgi:hypothetical protein
MISLYTLVPQIATKFSDTERKDNRKSVRVIIYTVVKTNSRPIGIGEREKWAVAHTGGEMHPRANLLIQSTKMRTSPPQQDKTNSQTTNPSSLQSLFSKMAVDRQPFTLHSSVPQTDTTNSLIERIVARIATVPWVTNCGRLELLCAQKNSSNSLNSTMKLRRQLFQTI